MAISNGYATLAELKARLDIKGENSDAEIEQMIEAASRMVDGFCGRTFFAATETRYFTAESPHVLLLDADLISVTTLATDSGDRLYTTVWGAGDYELEPNGPPYVAIYPSPQGQHHFPVGRRLVRITGTWGYADEAPHAIREATLLQAARLYKRKDAPFGIAGSADHGQMQTLPGMDPDVKQLLMPYRKLGLVGV